MKLRLKPPLLRVTSRVQSPVNAHRWLVTLACGHELWVTRYRRPTAEKYRCVDCYAAGGRVGPEEIAYARLHFKPS